MYIKFLTKHGHIEIYTEEFFPADAARIRKLYKIMRQDPRNHVDEISMDIKRDLLDYKAHLEQEKRFCGVKFFEWHQTKCDLFSMIESGKHPNGTTVRRGEMKDIKERHRNAKKYESEYKRDATKADRTIKRLEKNLELINSLEE